MGIDHYYRICFDVNQQEKPIDPPPSPDTEALLEQPTPRNYRTLSQPSQVARSSVYTVALPAKSINQLGTIAPVHSSGKSCRADPECGDGEQDSMTRRWLRSQRARAVWFCVVICATIVVIAWAEIYIITVP